jgi:peptidoglycan/xylan/chitin deacetylase (PgdA/CDA1 family)
VATRTRLEFPGRGRVAAARLWCERRGRALGRRLPAPRSRILCFHSVGTPEWGVNDVAPARFRRHLEAALELGYRFVPASELADELSGGAGQAGPGEGGPAKSARDERLLAVTFDDGARTVATVAAPILASYGIPWTVFVVTDWASGNHRHPALLLNWAEIERIVSDGGLVGSHSVSHRDLGLATLADARHELEASKEIIAKRIGVNVTEFAIPLGQSANWHPELLDLAREAGFRWVYAQSEARRPPGTTARTFVTRFDDEAVFRAALGGAFDRWEEWY